MPTDEQKPDASKEGTLSDGDKSGTAPEKIMIDGVEVSVDDLKAGLESKKNEAKWRADLDNKGKEANEMKRGLKNLETQLTEKLTYLKSELDKVKNPPVDLEGIEDPEERRKAEAKVLTKKIEGLEDTIASLQQERKSDKEQTNRQTKAAYWQGIIDDTMDKYGRELDELDKEDLIEKTEAKMGRENVNEWSPELWREKAKLSLDQINRKNQKNIDNYGKKKGEKDKDISLDKGGTDTPKLERITSDDDQDERIAKMKRNEERT